MRAPLQVLVIGVVALGGALAGFLGYRSWQGPGREPIIAAAPVPPAADIPEDPAVSAPPATPVPETLPDLQLPDARGNSRSLRDFLGHPLIVNFWATWCAPCRREIPLLQQLRSSYKSDALEIVGIAVDFPNAVAEYLRHTPIAYPLLIGEDQGLAAAEKFGMEPVLPFSVFADGGGHIIAIKVGELHQDEADAILGAMHLIAAGKQTLPQARADIAQRLRALAIERAKSANNPS
jgi:thiol-disulfide isomerase/thioredoxin